MPWVDARAVTSSDAEEFDRWTPDAGIVRGYTVLLLAILDEPATASATPLGTEMTWEPITTGIWAHTFAQFARRSVSIPVIDRESEERDATRG